MTGRASFEISGAHRDQQGGRAVAEGDGDALLLALVADTIDHPGGTLYTHLHRVAATLDQWDATPTVQYAGLCHAFYGTDGFAPTLLALSERDRLTRAVGPQVEALVYLYSSCERAAVYPQIGEPGPLLFTDRFTTRTSTLTGSESRAFLEITAANELDVLTHNPEMASRYGAELLQLFIRAGDLLSREAQKACRETLAPLI